MQTRTLAVLLLGGITASISGCGSSPRYAPVSGRITLDGKPIANAIVMFQPIPPAGSAIAAAPGSNGKTNANGEYTLMVATGESGAWVGKHTVMIELRSEQVDVNSDNRPRGGWPQVNRIPPKYNSETMLSFDVPKEGTTTANFELESK